MQKHATAAAASDGGFKACEVLFEQEVVRIFYEGQEVARHRRSSEPHTRVVEPSHYEGLWRVVPSTTEEAPPPVETFGRSLAEYAAIVEGSGG